MPSGVDGVRRSAWYALLTSGARMLHVMSWASPQLDSCAASPISTLGLSVNSQCARSVELDCYALGVLLQCGISGGLAVCTSTAGGPCCSQYGWCGSTPDYCGAGCQAAYGSCTGAPSASPLPQPSVPRFDRGVTGGGGDTPCSVNRGARQTRTTHNTLRSLRSAQLPSRARALFFGGARGFFNTLP